MVSRPLIATLLAVLSLGGAPSAGADDAGAPAHYVVLEIDADGVALPVFHRRVRLAEPPESVGDADLEHAREIDPEGDRLVTLRLMDATGRIAFRNVVRPARWIRGEFEGRLRPEGGSEIEAHRFPDARRAFVARVPDVPGARLVVEGRTREVFDLDRVARSAGTLPLASMASYADEAVTAGVTTNPGNRVDMLIMGDGYTSAQMADFDADATNLQAAFFGITPYAEYANYVNVTTMFTASAESGADHPPYDPSCTGDDPSCCADGPAQNDPLAGTYVDTAFDGRYCAFNVHRLAVVDNAAVLAAASAVPDWDNILVLLNDTTYGGSGGAIPVTSVHSAAVDIARHEYGHSFTDLADEYDTPFPGFPGCSDVVGPPCEANVTDETDRDLIKWSPWILPSTPIPTPEGNPSYADVVGLFRGARYLTSGMYRPRDTDCLMNFLGVPFGEVCVQEYVLVLYRGGWGVPAAGIDTIEPGSASPAPGTLETCVVSFDVDLLAPVGGPPLDVAWWVDGAPVPGATTDSFAFAPTTANTYPVEIRVRDATALVHPDMAGTALDSSRQWTVDCTCDVLPLPPALGSLAVGPTGLSWNPAATAGGYDVVRGDMSALRASGGDFAAATEECVAEDHRETSLPYSANPPAGEAFWFLVRGMHCGSSGTWDTGGPAQVGSRDGEVEMSGLGCGTASCGDGVREDGEACDGADLDGETCQSLGFDDGVLQCAPSCESFDTTLCHLCGNDVCEIFGGEDCLSCPQDCNGVQQGNPANRYCCGDGEGDTPVGCEDPRCTADGNTCVE